MKTATYFNSIPNLRAQFARIRQEALGTGLTLAQFNSSVKGLMEGREKTPHNWIAAATEVYFIQSASEAQEDFIHFDW